MTDQEFPKTLVIAVWFGPLPSWLPVWLNSCGWNPELDWLLVTDAELTPPDVPQNVHVVNCAAEAFARRVEAFAGVPIRLGSAYKTCDYRPLFSCLLDLVPGEWEFWGHCDLDMVFGNIRNFVSPALMHRYDRLFGQGHFSLYRNEPRANEFFRLSHPDLDYRDILSDPRHRAFDEHLGVNKIWHWHDGAFYENEAVVADIDPHTRQIRRMGSETAPFNSRVQAFGFDSGRVFRAYVRRGRVHTDEFMYMHFQKRHLSRPVPPDGFESAWFTKDGFVPLVDHGFSELEIRTLNPAPLVPDVSETFYRVRRRARFLRRRIKGSSGD